MHVYRCANGDYLIAGFELTRTHDVDTHQHGQIDHRACGFEDVGAADTLRILVRVTPEQFFRTQH